MKNWRLLVIFALIIVLGGVASFFLLQPNSQTASTSTTPIVNPFADASNSGTSLTSFTISCYKSYIQSYIANTEIANPGQYDKDAQSCFTPDFINEWPSIISNSEGDPVLLSQDYYNSWTTNISAIVSNQSTTNANVIVNLGAGSEMHELEVSLQMTSDGWRISGVSPAQQ